MVELLVVISIIATLTAILLPNFMGARERARDAQKKQDLGAIKNALRLYYNDNQSYPPDTTDLSPYLNSYMPSILGIGFTYIYTQTNTGDGFTIKAETEATKAEENGRSQVVCGVGTTDSRYFMVCAN